LPLPSVQSNRVIFFRIAWLAMWYNQCIVIKTSLNLSDIMHIVECLTTGPSNVIAPVGVTSSWHYRVITPVGITSSSRHLWRHSRTLGLEFLKFATIRAQNAHKISQLVKFSNLSSMQHWKAETTSFLCSKRFENRSINKEVTAVLIQSFLQRFYLFDWIKRLLSLNKHMRQVADFVGAPHK
jgi:hypothetical protein